MNATAASPRWGRALPPVYGAAAVRLALSWLLLPLMASRLGAAEFGRLGLLLSWSALLALLVEGGFQAAATRLAVEADAARRWQLAQQVFSARCGWSAVVLAAALAVAFATAPAQPAARSAADGLLLALLACATGWPANWYLQATQQLHRWALVELVVLAAWLAVGALWVHSVEAFVAAQAAAWGLLSLLGWRWLRRDLAGAAGAGALFAPARLREGLALGGAMLPVSLLGAAYSYALPALASARLPREELGLYFLADRLVRTLLAAADPLVQLVYPRLVQRFAQRGARAALALAARWALGGALAGALAWAVLVGAGPALWAALPRVPADLSAARLMPVLSLLGLLLPLLLGWRFIGYWMLGGGRYDGAYRACVAAGGVAGLVGAWAWADGGARALAGVALTAELVVIVVACSGVAWTQAQRTRAARDNRHRGH